eukprot:TRINITY_DN12130_c0_g1_i1.p1 TRINITY_DN12130_c0_g1~~TRINITY_DN12130_c0_g1_i1.p1  ORF type:complete len:100 (+),score=13.67 TRINITY_DN12130_c0_g1_i1:107-406(+)
MPSLVGSEMCIRDRHRVADETHSQYKPDFSIHYEKDGEMKRVYLEHYGAVSYTHLTLPTICSVQISVVAVSVKKKKREHIDVGVSSHGHIQHINHSPER